MDGKLATLQQCWCHGRHSSVLTKPVFSTFVFYWIFPLFFITSYHPSYYSYVTPISSINSEQFRYVLLDFQRYSDLYKHWLFHQSFYPRFHQKGLKQLGLPTANGTKYFPYFCSDCQENFRSSFLNVFVSFSPNNMIDNFYYYFPL